MVTPEAAGKLKKQLRDVALKRSTFSAEERVVIIWPRRRCEGNTGGSTRQHRVRTEVAVVSKAL
eukprot:2103504-Pleurochrysis_carterae.AAC.1